MRRNETDAFHAYLIDVQWKTYKEGPRAYKNEKQARTSDENYCGRQVLQTTDTVKQIGLSDTHFGQLFELPGAVTDPLSRHTEEIQKRQLQVGQGRVLRIHEMTAAFERAATAADE
jgi:hypothetical protein